MAQTARWPWRGSPRRALRSTASASAGSAAAAAARTQRPAAGLQLGRPGEGHFRERGRARRGRGGRERAPGGGGAGGAFRAPPGGRLGASRLTLRPGWEPAGPAAGLRSGAFSLLEDAPSLRGRRGRAAARALCIYTHRHTRTHTRTHTHIPTRTLARGSPLPQPNRPSEAAAFILTRSSWGEAESLCIGESPVLRCCRLLTPSGKPDPLLEISLGLVPADPGRRREAAGVQSVRDVELEFQELQPLPAASTSVV